MNSPIRTNIQTEDNHSGSPSSPSSKRSAFRPISKMHDFLSKDPFASSSSSGERGKSSIAGIHVMTPQKSKLGGFFGSSSQAAGRSKLGEETPVQGKRLSGMPSSRRASVTGRSEMSMKEEITATPKIRAGMTPEARTRHMPPVKPIRQALGASTGHNLNSGTEERQTTVRLVRNVVEDDHYEPDLPVFPTSGLSRPTIDYQDPLAEENLDQLQNGLDEMSLDQWNASRAVDETVMVTIRIRPISNATESNAWSTLMDAGSSRPRTIRLADGSRKDWHFDQILPTTTSNAEAYLTSALPHVRSAMLGYNSLCFAYGQTGSGKSHTMAGTPQSPGVVPLAVEEIFRIIKRETGREWVLRASYLELYNEALGDLLAPDGSKGEVTILNGKKEGEVKINGLTEMVVTTASEVKKVLAIGEGRRRTGCTNWNERSSRSHSVFRIVIESRAKSLRDDDIRGNNKATRISTLSLIDLAGSERATDNKERNAEGKHINQSLLTLKNVISKLAEQSARKTTGHVPFRDSKLTRLLQPSLSGDAKISVICTINPAQSHITESQSTLNFAAGIKRVVLNAKQTEVVDPAALIQQYQNEIAELKAKLAARDASAPDPAAGPRRITVAQREESDRFRSRLTELTRLIITSTSVEEEELTNNAEHRPPSPTRQTIDNERSTFSLQEELCVAQNKVNEQQAEIERLQRELALRPKNVDERCSELQLQVDQLTEMTQEYEKNLLEPARKVREDVEAEWLPKVQALEARAKEKETFYKSLYDSVHHLKSELSRSKEKNARLQSTQSQYLQLLREVESTMGQENSRLHDDLSEKVHMTMSRMVSGGSQDELGALRPVQNNPRVPSVGLQSLVGKMAATNMQAGAGLRSVREDSCYDLNKQLAYVDRPLGHD